MPSIQPRDGRFQLRVKNKLLPRPYFSTFDTYDEADQYGKTLMSWLKKGIVPAALIAEAPQVADPLVVQVIKAYEKLGPVTPADTQLLNATASDMLGVRVSHVTSAWVDSYVKRLKMTVNNAPGTIRKKVGLYGRILDWHFRRSTPDGGVAQTNPFRTLPRGYSTYTRDEAKQLAEAPSKVLATIGRGAGKTKAVKRDQTRERRLHADEEQRVAMALRGERLPGAKWVRPPNPDLAMLLAVIVDSGVRLSEAYTLRVSYLHLDRGFMQVDGSKGRDGVVKPRIVPLKQTLIEKLKLYIEGKDAGGLLFPYWDGTATGKKLATRALVQSFRRLFAHAQVSAFTEHDLRHEACCRWFELRGKDGRWMFSDVEICRIMGWSNYAMVMRYASLRGEDLAARMNS